MFTHTHTHTGTECAVYMYTLHMSWHTPTHNIQYTHTHTHTTLKSGLGPSLHNKLVAEANVFRRLCLRLLLFYRTVSFSSSTSQSPYKRQLKRMCYTGSVWGERREREREKRREKWEGTRVREAERERERKRGSMRGKMYSTTSPSKPWLIPCLLIFITIAASCKMFDGFVQILVPLIHNYCYTCRTKGNFRRGAVWKAAARLWGWWEISAGASR